jgi:hypothetical protein
VLILGHLKVKLQSLVTSTYYMTKWEAIWSVGIFVTLQTREYINLVFEIIGFRNCAHWFFLLDLGILRATHTQDCGHVTVALKAFSMAKKEEPVQVCFKVNLRDRWSKWMQDGCKVYMDSCVASIWNESCFMVTWIIFQTHRLVVSLAQNQETITLWNLTTIHLLHLSCVMTPT